MAAITAAITRRGKRRGERDANLRILVVRADRIGDVVLSTPVFAALKRDYPDAHITALVQAAVAPLLRGLPTIDEVKIYAPNGRHRGLRGSFRLWRDLRAAKYKIVIMLQVQFKLALVVFVAGIRYRVAPLSKPYSFLFFNRGIRQRRSRVEMHEADYNLQLLRRIGIRSRSRLFSTQVSANESAQNWASAFFQESDSKNAKTSRTKRVAVHPGMGGSALNWPESHYLELIRSLLNEGRQVLVTGGPTEQALLQRIREGLGEDAARTFWYEGSLKDGVDRLAALFDRCDVVVAPSTGPLHLAVARGRPVVCFFPPIRVQSALRWGPYRPDEERASVLVPDVFCGQDFACRGPKCHYYPCMKSISVTQALDEVERQLRIPPAE